MKKLFDAIIRGAGVAIGSFLITKGIHAMQDPVKRAKIKNKFEKIKATITE